MTYAKTLIHCCSAELLVCLHDTASVQVRVSSIVNGKKRKFPQIIAPVAIFSTCSTPKSAGVGVSGVAIIYFKGYAVKRIQENVHGRIEDVSSWNV